MNKRAFSLIKATLFVFLIAFGQQAMADLIINNGSTLILNNATMDLNCNDTLVNTGGTLNLGGGIVEESRNRTVNSVGTLIVGGSTTNACTVHSDNSQSTATEGGNSGSFTLQLGQAPTGAVEFTFTPDAQCTITSPNPLSINDAAIHTATVQAVDDATVEDEATNRCTIGIAITASGDNATYPTSLSIDSVIAQIIDNDITPTLTIAETAGSTDVDELQTITDSYTVTPISGAPFVNIETDGQCEIAISPSTSFSTETAFTISGTRTIQVRGINDRNIEGPHVCTIVHTPFAGSTTKIANDVNVNITDNGDGAGHPPAIIIEETASPTTSTEGGASSTYTVRLDSIPTDTVTITPLLVSILGIGIDNFEVIAKATNNQVTFTPNTLTFAADSSALTAQTVTITAIDDSSFEASFTSTIGHKSTSNDANYNDTQDINSVQVVPDSLKAKLFIPLTVFDDDTVSLVITESAASTDVNEQNSTTDTYDIALSNNQDQTVNISTDGQCIITSTNPVQFVNATSTNPQTVTVQAVNDGLVEAAQHTCVITHSVAEGDTIKKTALTINVKDDGDVQQFRASPH